MTASIEEHRLSVAAALFDGKFALDALPANPLRWQFSPDSLVVRRIDLPRTI